MSSTTMANIHYNLVVHLTQLSLPLIANAVRSLSKSNAFILSRDSLASLHKVKHQCDTTIPLLYLASQLQVQRDK